MSQTILPQDAVLWASHDFQVVNECSRFKPIQLSYLNAYGVRDYWTWTTRNTLTITSEKETYYRDLGTWSKFTWSANSWDRGTQTFNQVGKVRMTLSTNWISESESLALEQLFTSPEIKVYHQDEWLAATVLTQRYDQKTHAREVNLIRYEIEIEFSVPKKRQRG